mmetsp:Transcript_151924/g.487592  ORF Transcript_151924/g.487592 Transcript_151924/m.487592 type:complete len:643 (-) Transcript_151924:3390-5318(-)
MKFLLQRYRGDADVVLVRLVGVGRALVALQGHPTLLAVALRPRPHAGQAPDGVLLGALEDLQGLAHVQLPQRLALGDVKGRGEGDAPLTDKHLLFFQALVALQVLECHPTGYAIFRRLALYSQRLKRLLLPGALQNLQDFPCPDRTCVSAAALKGRLQLRCLLAEIVQFRRLLHKRRPLVAGQRGPSLLRILDRPTTHSREAGVAVARAPLQDLNDLAQYQLPDCLALLDFELSRNGDLLHTSLVLLQHVQQGQLCNAGRQSLDTEVQMARLQARIGYAFEEGAQRRRRHGGRLALALALACTAELGEELRGLQGLAHGVLPQGALEGELGIASHLLAGVAKSENLLLAPAVEGASLDLELDELAPDLAERALPRVLDFVHQLLDLGQRTVDVLRARAQGLIRLVHGFQGAVGVGSSGGDQRLGCRACLLCALLGLANRFVRIFQHLVCLLLLLSFLSPLLLVLHGLQLLLLRVGDRHLQLLPLLLDLPDTRLHGQQRGLRLRQRPLPHTSQLIALGLDVLLRLHSGFVEVLDRLLHAALDGGQWVKRHQVGGAAVGGHGDVSLLLVLLGFCFDAHQADAGFFCGLLQLLHDLVDLQLAHGLAALHLHDVRHSHDIGDQPAGPEMLGELGLRDLALAASFEP